MKNILNKCYINNQQSRKLKNTMEETNEEEISSKIFSFKNMFSEEDLRAMSSLMDLLNEDIDFVKASTEEIKIYLKNMKLIEPPQTTFIVKEGTLK